jgi:pimeloyl-ACP methyl ester carboxylesterase
MTAPVATSTATAATTAAVASYIARAAAIRQQVLRYLALQWSGLKAYRDSDAERFVAAILPMVLAGQRQTSMLTTAYLANAAGALGATRAPASVAADAVAGTALRGVDPADVYSRPFETVWTQLSLGKPLDDAVRAGADRLQAIAATDLQLAATHTTAAATEQMPHVAGYRRVLTGSENCGLCVIASTQRYHRGDLMPIHPRCDCAVAPIIGDHDPGQSINSSMLTTGAMPSAANKHGVQIYSGEHLVDLGDLLEPVHDAVKAEFGRAARDARSIDYRKVITVHEHGEIGPVLTVKGHKFTGKQIESGDLAAKPTSRAR